MKASKEQILKAQRLEQWDNSFDVIEILSVIPEGRILEMGCGTGRIIEDLTKHLLHSCFIGIDIDHYFLTIARKKNLRNTVLICSSATEHLFPANTFDVVLFRDSVHEIREQLGEHAVRSSIQNAFHYLKHGGALIIRDAIHIPAQTICVKLTSEPAKRVFHTFTKLRNIPLQSSGIIELQVKEAISFFSNYRRLLFDPQIESLPQAIHYSLLKYDQLLSSIGFTQSEIRLYRFSQHLIPEDILVDAGRLPKTYCMLVYNKY